MNKTRDTLVLAILVATGLGCGYSKPSMQTSMPSISQLSPGTATAGSAQFQLEVDGANFISGAMVNFNGVAQPTTFVSAAKLEATIPASALTTPAMVPVTVTDPATGGMYGTGVRTSAAMTFTVN
jgi:hypothetical protein